MIKSTQRGFTLIELVVVIVILGILAAFAVPRFMNLEGDARAATLKSYGGALLAAATMARAKCQAQDCGSVVRIDNVDITMVNGYPNRDSIAALMDPSAAKSFRGAIQGTTAQRFTRVGGGANCWVQYNQAGTNSPPTVTYYYTLANNPSDVAVRDFNRNLATVCRG